MRTSHHCTLSPYRCNVALLAGNLLVLAGYHHATPAFAQDTLTLIADALEIVNPDDEAHTQRARDLAHHFRMWAEALTDAQGRGTRSGARAPTTHTHVLVPLEALYTLRYRAEQTQLRGDTVNVGALRAAAEELPYVTLSPIRIALAVEGGIVQNGAIESQLPVDLAVVDYDANDDTARPIRQESGETALAWVYEPPLGPPTIQLADVFPNPDA